MQLDIKRSEKLTISLELGEMYNDIKPNGAIQAVDFVIEVTNKDQTELEWLTIEASYIFKTKINSSHIFRSYWISTFRFQNIKSGRKVDAKAQLRLSLADKNKELSFFRTGKITKIYGKYSNQSPFVQTLIDTSNKPSDCFVVTASYGDEKHPVVQSFRSLRDEVLSRSIVGKKFTNWYYRHGPTMASKIRGKPLLMAAARSILTPLAITIEAIRGRKLTRAPNSSGQSKPR